MSDCGNRGDIGLQYTLTAMIVRMRNLERTIWRMHELTRDCLPPDTQEAVDGLLSRHMAATEDMEGPEGLGLEYETVERLSA